MPPALTSAPERELDLVDAFVAHLRTTGRQCDGRFTHVAERFFARWPDPAGWAAEPLEVRLGVCARTRQLLIFLMLHGHLRPGYDYLLSRTLISLWRELATSPLNSDMQRFLAATRELGYSDSGARGAAGLVCARVLIQSGRRLDALTGGDLAEFEAALAERERRTGRRSGHYRRMLFSTRSALYHLGILAQPPTARPAVPAQPFEQRLTRAGVPEWLRATFLAYLERLRATHSRSTVCGTATKLGQFGRHLAEVDPELGSLAQLDRRRHIETYLAAVAQARRAVDGGPISIEERRGRVITINCFLNDIGQWGWSEAPPRRLIFPRDIPRRPKPLPRYLPVDEDRRLAEALARSPRPLAANALLLARATGIRIGELVDLELDCVHEISRQGAWLKVPLGKLDTERMVPLDDDAVAKLVSQALNVDDADAFWERVRTNLAANRLRLVFVADEIPGELARIVEYLNEQMTTTEVLAIEIKQYVDSDGRHQTLVPRLVGQTEAAKRAKGRTPARHWDRETVLEELETKRGKREAEVARAVVEWADTLGDLRFYFGSGQKDGSLQAGLDDGVAYLFPFVLYTYGRVEVQFQFIQRKPPFDELELRRELQAKLNAIPGVAIADDALDKRPSIPLDVLANEGNVDAFLTAMEWAFSQAKARTGQ
jgi:integrase